MVQITVVRSAVNYPAFAVLFFFPTLSIACSPIFLTRVPLVDCKTVLTQ